MNQPESSGNSAEVPLGVLLDIEGTTSSISFVYDQMFPYIRRELSEFLANEWNRVDVQHACEQIASDAGYESLQIWAASVGGLEPPQLVNAEVIQLMDDDVKATGLKLLQGLIWQSGFESGELVAHVFDDVLPCLRIWHQAGHDLRIYSSGSVAAQRLFFGHTIVGNLLPMFRKHYDTTTGNKKEAASYAIIADDFQLDADQILFLSDVTAELDAAQSAGIRTCVVCRPGNMDVLDDCQHRKIHKFTELL